MRRKNHNHGYSQELVKEYLDSNKPIISLSTKTDTQYIWKDGHRTNEISGYRAYFAQEGVGPFTVKFEQKTELPPFLSQVVLKDLVACEVGNNVYFKAQGIKG